MNTSNLDNLQTLSKSIEADTQDLVKREAAVDKLRADLADRAARFAKLAHSVSVAAARPQAGTAPQVAKSNGPKPAQRTKRARHRKAKGVIQFRDPANPKHEWTGRGTVPNWITESGKGKEAFRVGGQSGA